MKKPLKNPKTVKQIAHYFWYYGPNYASAEYYEKILKFYIAKKLGAK